MDELYVVVPAVISALVVLSLTAFGIVRCCRRNKNNQFNIDNANNEPDTTTMTSNVVMLNETKNYKEHPLQKHTRNLSQDPPQKPPRVLLPALIPTQSNEIDSFQDIPLDRLENSNEIQQDSDYDRVWTYKSA